MAYDEGLRDRIRQVVGARQDVTEKNMFGGVAFLLEGKMFCGVTHDDLMVRVGPENHERALADEHSRPMDFTGRPMKGYVFVGPDGTATEASLAKWVDLALGFVGALNARPPKKKRRR